MRQPQTLPTASPRSLLQTFQDVFRAREDTVFTQKALEKRGVSGYRQALTALNFLGMITKSGRLDQETRDLRADRDRLTDLLRGRLKAACVRVGCDAEAVADLGCRRLSEDQLRELLRTLPPVVRQQGNKYVVANMVSCMQTLHELLERRLDRDWIESELVALEAREQLSGRSKPRKPGLNASEQLGARLEILANGRVHGNCQQTCYDNLPAHERGSEAGVLHVPPARRVDLSDCALIAETITVDFNGEIAVTADVYYPAGLSALQLKRVARHLLQRAQLLDGARTVAPGCEGLPSSVDEAETVPI